MKHKESHSYSFSYTRRDGSRGRLYRTSKQDLKAQVHWFKKRFPYFTDCDIELDHTPEILSDLRANSAAAYKKLQDKCRWEQMTLTAVLAEYGDPRLWV